MNPRVKSVVFFVVFWSLVAVFWFVTFTIAESVMRSLV